MARGVFRGRACEGEPSLTAGTVFQDTRKPVRMWVLAMWFIPSQKNGVSALSLQRVLGLGNCEAVAGNDDHAFRIAQQECHVVW